MKDIISRFGELVVNGKQSDALLSLRVTNRT